jgi:CheY-like chemotaxis protein
MTDEPEQVNQNPAAKPDDDQDKRRVLMLLEDDFALRSLLQVMFEQWGFKALAFSDGYRAAAWLDQVAAGEMTETFPELALLDIRVPGPLGTEIAHRMRITPATAKIPIVIMTAYRMDSVETDTLLKAINPNGFLHKGDMDFESLHSQLMSILESSKEPVKEESSPTIADPQPIPGKDKDEVPGTA